MFRKKITISLGLLIMLAGLSLFLQSRHLTQYPSAVHVWAQADRYALAQGFISNGLNFFQPQTHIYNHQFPDHWAEAGETTLTAVDFPLHDYLAAVLMKIAGTDAVWIFKLYVLLYGIVGLFFLYCLVELYTKSGMKALLVVLLAACSPVFVYYQSSLLPTVPSWSNVVIGLYFYMRYHQSGQSRHFILSLFFMLLATWARTTFIIPWLSMLGVEFMRVIRSGLPWRKHLLYTFLAGFLWLAWKLYAQHLSQHYGSDFLSSLRPATSLQELLEICKTVFQRYHFYYFSAIQLLLILVLFPLARIGKRVKNFKFTALPLFTGIHFLGSLAFFLAMCHQFPDHDYYFIDTFFLPLLLLLTLLLARIDMTGKILKPVFIVLLLLALPTFAFTAKKAVQKKYLKAAKGRMAWNISNFYAADRFLDSIGVAADARILVLDARAPNLPFTFLRRSGYAVMTMDSSTIAEALSWDYDYVVTQNSHLATDVLPAYPALLQQLQVLGSNGKITLSRRQDQKQEQELSAFETVPEAAIRWQEIVDFESEPSPYWQGFKRSDSLSWQGNYAGALRAEDTYGLTYKRQKLRKCLPVLSYLHVQGQFYAESSGDCQLVVALSHQDKKWIYKQVNLMEELDTLGQWKNLTYTFTLPAALSQKDELAIYFWNTGHSQIYFDALSLSLY